ncbi:hypothetical protein MTO96_018154 [Rhipicephalus appendiculatus]
MTALYGVGVCFSDRREGVVHARFAFGTESCSLYKSMAVCEGRRLPGAFNAAAAWAEASVSMVTVDIVASDAVTVAGSVAAMGSSGHGRRLRPTCQRSEKDESDGVVACRE